MRRWTIGRSVVLVLADDTRVRGQVWTLAPTEGEVWVALDDGTYARVDTRSGRVVEGREGRVAA